MFFCISEGGLDAIRLRVQIQQCRELRLPACAAVIENQYFGDHTSELGAKILLHQSQRKINSGAHAGRCPYRAIDHKDTIFLDGDLGVAMLHVSREVPMRGRSSTVQQPCLRENQRTGTDRNYASASMN